MSKSPMPVERLWPGETVAILATGPSLTPIDVDYCRGKVRVIAINDAWKLAPWADVLYSSDQGWWPHHKGAPRFAGLKYGIAPRGKTAGRFPKHPEIHVLEHTGVSGLELTPTGIRHGQNSGYAAINLAVHFGVSRILLLGYNLGLIGAQRHYAGAPPGMTTNSDYQGWLRTFETLVKPLQALGVEVFNCTPKTRLHCFPEAALRDVLVSPAVEAVA